MAENPALGKRYEEISKEILGFKTGKHIIFYSVPKQKEVEIIRVLHARMDLKKRLTE